MPKFLRPNATLQDLQSAPKEREAFIRRALRVMHSESKGHGAVTLRLGTTGTGQLPNYRIEDAAGAVIVAIDGNNHQPWTDNVSITSPVNWSTVTMSHTDVENALADLTGYTKSARAQAAH